MQRDFITILISIIALAFAALLPFGTNVPYTRRPQLTRYLVLVNVAIHIITQIIDIQSGLPLTRVTKLMAEQDTSSLLIQQYMDTFGLTPDRLLRGDQPWRWIQIVTANFLHGSWLHLIMNMWFFVLFSVNIEDAFGPKKYLLTIVAAMLGSQLCVAFCTPEGSEAATHPHLGFSGVVYAVMAAYLVCFPRSKIRVMLIYNLWFWLIGLFGAGFLAILLWLFVGSLAQLLWLLAFVGLFVAMQPGHLVFGIPAFVFLGFRVLYDGLTLEKQMWSSGVSVWSHAGGFMVGVTAALIVYGTKGIAETWEDRKEEPEELSREEQAKRQKENLIESAQGDRAAALAALGRFVFLRDSAAAAALYTNVILPSWPDMTLEFDLQLDLARMLELRGQWDLAIHAYDNLLRAYPNASGVGTAYLAAAKLSEKIPERLGVAIRYLNKMDTMDCLMRDKLEGRRVRGEIEAFARSKDVDLSEDLNTVFQGVDEGGRDAHSRGGQHWESRLPMSRPPASSRASSRIQQIEPAAEAPPDQRHFQTGRKPLPLSSLRRTEEGAEKHDEIRTGRSTYGVKDDAPIKLPPPKRPIASEGDSPGSGKPEKHAGEGGESRSSAPPTQPQRESLILPADNDDRIDIRGPINLTGDAGNEGPATHDESEDLFLAPPIADGSTTEKGLESLDIQWSAPEKKDEGSPAGQREQIEKRTFALILEEGAPVNPSGLLAELTRHFGDVDKARDAISTGKGCLASSLSAVDASRLAKQLRDAGVAAAAILEQNPALENEPCEAISCAINHDHVELIGPSVHTTIAVSDVALLTCSAMKLSPSSKTYRTVLEIVPRMRSRRIQMWDRTLAVRRCSVDGSPVTPDTAFAEFLQALCARVPSNAVSASASRAAEDFAHIPAFDSYREYENYVRFCILSRLGNRLR